MIGRIFLFGSGVVSLLLLTLIYSVVSGEYEARQPVVSPTSSAAESSAAASASAGASASASVNAEPSPSPSGTTAMVMIAALSFGPDLTIAAGTTVTFVNQDAVLHTATNGTNGVPAPGSLFNVPLEVGGSGSYTFTDPGTFEVTCTLHPTMNMIVTVQ